VRVETVPRHRGLPVPWARVLASPAVPDSAIGRLPNAASIRPARRLAPSRRVAEVARVLASPCRAAYSSYRLVLMASIMRIILDIRCATGYRSRPGEP
jgi:hypothetical protein